jgi:hypothetical protein
MVTGNLSSRVHTATDSQPNERQACDQHREQRQTMQVCHVFTNAAARSPALTGARGCDAIRNDN